MESANFVVDVDDGQAPQSDEEEIGGNEEEIEEAQSSHESLNPSARVRFNHPSSQVIGKVTDPVKTRRQIRDEVSHCSFCLI